MKLTTLGAATLAVMAALFVPSKANAQTPPPGAIFDLAVTHPTPLSSTVYQQFSTTFVATATSEYVSFAFREVPAYFGFDDVSVVLQGGTTNLLADPGFESDTSANVGTNFPVGWSRWIQAVDTSAIGVVAGAGNNTSCSGPHTGSFFWCDGSVEGYDALYQLVTGLTPGSTYVVTFWLTDNSDEAITNPTIDLLVYAGPTLPTGAVTIGTTPTAPAPKGLYLVLLGLMALAFYQWRKTRVASLLCLALIVGLSVRGAAPTQKWALEGGDKTAPHSLSIAIDGSSVSGTLDGATITRGGAEGGYFWFHANRNGVDTVYKGQIRDGKMILNEASAQGHRHLIFAKSK
jgi:hypothetical protein